MTNNDNQRQASLQTYVVYVEDKTGVLNRVASLFRRRAFNIESLTVGRTEQPGISRMTIVMEGDNQKALRFEALLYKLVNVLRVENISKTSSVERDLALIKIRSSTEARGQILQICDVFRARPVDIGVNALIVEITGSEEKIDGLIDVLRPFGIIEMARTGLVAMTRGTVAPSIDPNFVPATVPQKRKAALYS